MVRVITAAAVLLAMVSAVLALAGVVDLDEDEAVRGVPFDDPGLLVHPGLRSLEQLAGPGGEPRDVGFGVYPALTARGRLRFPSDAALRSARNWLATRRGGNAFAVADGPGAVRGVRPRERYRSASLIKAMLLVAFLRQLEEIGREPTSFEGLSMGYMIRVSDNASSDAIYRRVGDGLLRELARRSGMRHFEIAGDWANATVTAADQARFFLILDRLVPPRFLPLARNLLETVSPLHTWGIPKAARPRWRTFFKGGWRPEAGAEVVHQGALLESGAARLGLAVMTRGNPSMRYGEETIEGTARLLLGRSDAAPR